jgi:hypothetical protein
VPDARACSSSSIKEARFAITSRVVRRTPPERAFSKSLANMA